jgi:hypothetical protein
MRTKGSRVQLAAGAPDPGFQLDGRVLVKRGELVPLGLGDQYPLGVIEDYEQRRIHRSSSIPPEGRPVPRPLAAELCNRPPLMVKEHQIVI